MNEHDDLKWIDSKTGERVSYLETLEAQIKFRNGWISKNRWDALERKVSTMTEDEAKQELIKINDDIRSSITFERNCQ